MALAVVANCTKLKLSAPAPARELYVGPTARRIVEAVDWARSRGIRVGLHFISAMYGLVGEWDVLEPYDATLSGMGPEEARRWSRERGVLDAFRRLAEGATVILAVSRPYYAAVEEAVCGGDVYVLAPYRACGRWIRTGNFDRHVALKRLLVELGRGFAGIRER